MLVGHEGASLRRTEGAEVHTASGRWLHGFAVAVDMGSLRPGRGSSISDLAFGKDALSILARELLESDGIGELLAGVALGVLRSGGLHLCSERAVRRAEAEHSVLLRHDLPSLNCAAVSA